MLQRIKRAASSGPSSISAIAVSLVMIPLTLAMTLAMTLLLLIADHRDNGSRMVSIARGMGRLWHADTR